jgi:hypothetical protein
MKFALPTIAAAITASSLVSAHQRSFGIAKPSFFNKAVNQAQTINAVSADSAISLLRGGSDGEVEVESTEEVKLYLPGLLEASVSGKWVSTQLMFH